jgi:hypothetical protein
VEFISDAWFVAVAGADTGEIRERFLGVVGVFFEEPARTWEAWVLAGRKICA